MTERDRIHEASGGDGTADTGPKVRSSKAIRTLVMTALAAWPLAAGCPKTTDPGPQPPDDQTTQPAYGVPPGDSVTEYAAPMDPGDYEPLPEYAAPYDPGDYQPVPAYGVEPYEGPEAVAMYAVPAPD
jgi:hypothetical protein